MGRNFAPLKRPVIYRLHEMRVELVPIASIRFLEHGCHKSSPQDHASARQACFRYLHGAEEHANSAGRRPHRI